MSYPTAPKKVLVVCLGNICRSPTVEAVMRSKAQKAGFFLEIDSAGTADYHTGNAPDLRAIRHAAKRGYELSGMRARQVCDHDFEFFDLILAADQSNLADLRRRCPDEHAHKLRLFLSDRSLPDPYSGDEEEFETVLNLAETRCEELIASWISQPSNLA